MNPLDKNLFNNGPSRDATRSKRSRPPSLIAAAALAVAMAGLAATPAGARNPDNVVGNSVQELVDLHPTDNSFVGRRAGVSWNSRPGTNAKTGAQLWIGRARGPQPLGAAGPGDRFDAHFHAGPCGIDESGQETTEGHYKHDPSIEGAVDSNEIWFDITINSRDVGFARDRKEFFLREGEFQSVVIHNPRLGGAKVACLPIP